MSSLKDKKILIVICGGISAYKSLEFMRALRKNQAEIKTIITKSAKEFVTPLSITSLSQGKVYEDLFNPENEAERRSFCGKYNRGAYHYLVGQEEEDVLRKQLSKQPIWREQYGQNRGY